MTKAKAKATRIFILGPQGADLSSYCKIDRLHAMANHVKIHGPFP